jgi:alpha-D-ribose 1-methylphosphonate 5-triphosphate synthase subunit PhnI
MGYAAARGGLDAIEAAEELVRRRRLEGRSPWLEPDQLVERLGYAVDRVMGEGGLWAPDLAARALRQAEGDVIEAAHLVRTHRATLPRFGYTDAVRPDELELLRRIVPAYREAPGPQLLGRTLDYTGRLLDLTPDDQARQEAVEAAAAAAERPEPATPPPAPPAAPVRLLDVLRSQDLAVDRRRTDDPEPVDITRVAVRPGVERSALLSTMARAETGALVNLWYRNILGPDSYLHEVTLGEVRHGRLPVRVAHGVTGEPVRIGSVRITEVEAIEDLDGVDEARTHFDVGYGCCLGHNERKAIAMANLDISLHRDGGRSALGQSVLMTTDGLDASGFLEHLKLPHYVTFRSMAERKLTMRSERARTARRRRSTSAGDPAGPDTVEATS